MSDHDHGHPPSTSPSAPRARRDLLGLSALLGADSGCVPISDLDGGEAFGCASVAGHAPACGHPAGHEAAVAARTGGQPRSACHDCAAPCPSDFVALENVTFPPTWSRP